MILNKFNFYLMLFLATTQVVAAIIVPTLLFYTSGIFWYLSLLLLTPSVLFTNTTWALIHEGVHSNLNSDQQKNLTYSRLLSVLIHSNFEVLKFGHLMHHRYNRTDYDLTEGYDFQLIKNYNRLVQLLKTLKMKILYYFHISIGLYLAEIFGPLLLLLPLKIIISGCEVVLGKEHEYIKNGKKILLNSGKINKIRIDGVINILYIASIVILYRQYFWIYLIYLLIKGCMISSVDNLPHYGASLDKINGSFNLKAAKIWQKMILNFNYHRVHHKYPNLAWHLLPEKFISEQEYFDYDYFKHYRKQWNGIMSKDLLV